MEPAQIFSLIFLLSLIFSPGNSDPVEDKQALLDFLGNISLSRYLNWNQSSPVCKHWTGITCNEDGTRITAVRLPGVGFNASIPPNTISRLSSLEVLSLRSNAINGDFPFDDFSKLKNLSYLYLQYNDFSGPLPLNFSVWKNLTVLNLSNNRFNGSILHQFSSSTRLVSLNLANNSFSGGVPDLDLPSLQRINFSNNNLSGSIPESLGRFPVSSFSGNSVAFGSSFKSKSKPKTVCGINYTVFVLIVILGCALTVLALASLVLLCCLKRKWGDMVEKREMSLSSEKVVSRTEEELNNSLFFFDGCNYVFNLEDLLRASAEVLGKGVFGTAYKAILEEDGTAVVVKRLKEVGVGKRDFEQKMEIIGGIKHENVVELMAYYYSKDEKLMVYDYNKQGSVASMLHGGRGENKTALDWETRIRIGVGAARGLARIHTEDDGKLVHGNVKSSNIFLNSKQYGCVSDVGLSSITRPLTSPVSRGAGYRAPEVSDTRKSSQSCDVYSFGVFILELLTGKSPIHSSSGEEIIHLVRWVHSVVKEEWTAEVFDAELLRYPGIEEEMVEMLQLALACVARSPDQRPKMHDVVNIIENVRKFDNQSTEYSRNESESSTPAP